jgi:hypothetical protein
MNAMTSCSSVERMSCWQHVFWQQQDQHVEQRGCASQAYEASHAPLLHIAIIGRFVGVNYDI